MLSVGRLLASLTCPSPGVYLQPAKSVAMNAHNTQHQGGERAGESQVQMNLRPEIHEILSQRRKRKEKQKEKKEEKEEEEKEQEEEKEEDLAIQFIYSTNYLK